MKILKNNNLTLLDTDQIIKKKFDESMDAERVIIVGGEKLELSIDSDKIANAVKEGLSGLKIGESSKPEQYNVRQQEIQYVEKQVFLPQIEIKTIEVPVIIKEIEYREIEKPIYIEKIVTVEKPIVIKETEFKEVIKERHYQLIIKITSIVQALCIVGILLLTLFKRS